MATFCLCDERNIFDFLSSMDYKNALRYESDENDKLVSEFNDCFVGLFSFTNNVAATQALPIPTEGKSRMFHSFDQFLMRFYWTKESD